MTSKALRNLISKGEFSKPTAGYCPGHVQCNMLVLPRKYAASFAKFAQENSKAIPVLEIIKDDFYSSFLAKGANLLTEVPSYNVFEYGELKETVQDIRKYYSEELVYFLVGCSFTFESTILNANIPLRHIEENKNVSMYDTNIKLNSVDMFSGNMVVSMRPVPKNKVQEVYELTGHFPRMHGSPIHMGDPDIIGIKNILKPDYGDAVSIKEDEVPLFWPCGVTPENVLRKVKIPFAITHTPGHMFVSDKLDHEFYE